MPVGSPRIKAKSEVWGCRDRPHALTRCPDHPLCVSVTMATTMMLRSSLLPASLAVPTQQSRQRSAIVVRAEGDAKTEGGKGDDQKAAVQKVWRPHSLRNLSVVP